MTARPQSPALTPAIEALVVKAEKELSPLELRFTRRILTTLALAVAEEAAREATERAAKIAEKGCGCPKGEAVNADMLDACMRTRQVIARAIRGGADAE